MADLTYQIEVALGGTLTDLRSVVRGFSCGGGRQAQFESFQTGTCTFQIIDQTGDYIPGGDGLWSGETWVGREVKITVTAGGISHVIWRGHVEDIDVEFVDTNHALIDVTAVDPFALLGRTEIDAGTAFSSELSSTRIDNVLALSEVDTGYFTSSTKDITAGETTLQAESDAGGNTLQYLQLVEQSEGGRLFVRHGGDPGGVLAFRPRTGNSSDVGVTFQDFDPVSSPSLIDGGTAATGQSAVYSDTYSDTYGSPSWSDTWDGGTAADSPVAALDGGDATSRFEVRFTGVDYGFGSDFLVNRAVYTREGGSAQTVDNLASQSRYGIRPTSKSGLLNSTDADVLELAELRLSRASEPQRNVERLSALLDSYTDSEAALVSGLTVGDQVKVTVDTPGTVGSTLTSTVRIESVRHEVVPKRHRMSFRLTTLADEFGGSVDGGDATTSSFVKTWDGGDATTATFAGALDGGTAIFG